MVRYVTMARTGTGSNYSRLSYLDGLFWGCLPGGATLGVLFWGAIFGAEYLSIWGSARAVCGDLSGVTLGTVPTVYSLSAIP